jgi:Protein of unknown function (DUF3040)
MTLSEHEKRVLAEIEHTLSSESPKLASSLRSASSSRRWSRSRLAWPRGWAGGVSVRVGGLLLGLALVLLGVQADSGIDTAGAVIGYALIVVCVSATFTALRRGRHRRLWRR